MAIFCRDMSLGVKKIISAIFLVGMVIPLYSLLVPMFLQYKVLGMLNTRFVLILPYFAMQISLGILLCKSLFMVYQKK